MGKKKKNRKKSQPFVTLQANISCCKSPGMCGHTAGGTWDIPRQPQGPCPAVPGAVQRAAPRHLHLNPQGKGGR